MKIQSEWDNLLNDKKANEASAALQNEATVYDVAMTVHAHPTVSEVFMDAGLNAAGEPVHK